VNCLPHAHIRIWLEAIFVRLLVDMVVIGNGWCRKYNVKCE
jgi:hypothetical protein